MKHTTKTKDGRFIVRLPVRSSYKQLGDSFIPECTQYLQCLERRLNRQPDLKQEFVKFMEEDTTWTYIASYSNNL
jgi:hypothetical protein